MRIALVYLKQTLQSGFFSCSLLCCKLSSENHLLCLGSLLDREGFSLFVLAGIACTVLPVRKCYLETRHFPGIL